MENTGNAEGIVPPIEGVAGGGTAYGWIDGGCHASGPLKGPIDPTEVPSAALLHVWCMPSTANVGSQEIPRHLEPVNLLAARNERESVQIAIRPKVSWGGLGTAGVVQVLCNDLCSDKGNRLVVGQSLSVRRVMPILGVPDALVPLDLPVAQISLLPGETTAIWVSVDIPSAQTPGIYEGELLITGVKADAESTASCIAKAEKHQLYRQLKSCLDIMETVDQNPMDEVVERVKSATTNLRRVLLSPSFPEFFSDNGPVDMMVDDFISNRSIRVKLSVTVWDFTLPATPSLPAVFGISDTVIEDRFGIEHGSDEWFEALDQHFNWLLQYRISPYFCRWGDGMRVLTYTCPWPADHPKSDEYFSDPRLAAYAVPYRPVVQCGDTGLNYLQKIIEVLKTKAHWKKAYFYLWDEPLNVGHFNSIRSMASEIHSYAPDARVLTTYYCGPSDAPLAPTSFEAFLKVPDYLRPHTQIYCTSEWALGSREDLVKDIVSELQPENGEEWWTYVCMGPPDPHPNLHLGMRGTQHRAVMWRVWKEGGTGFLYWGTNCYEKATVASAEIRFRRGLPPGDGVLYYPSEVFSSLHQPVASVRLERLLSGLQDIEYLRLYASRYGRDEGLSLLERTGVYLSPERYTLEHLPIDVMRGEIYRFKEKLSLLQVGPLPAFPALVSQQPLALGPASSPHGHSSLASFTSSGSLGRISGTSHSLSPSVISPCTLKLFFFPSIDNLNPFPYLFQNTISNGFALSSYSDTSLAPLLSSFKSFPPLSSSRSSPLPLQSAPPPTSKLPSLLSSQGVYEERSKICEQESTFSSHVHAELLKKIATLPSESFAETEAMVSSMHDKFHVAGKEIICTGPEVSTSLSIVGEESSCVDKEEAVAFLPVASVVD
ncbi:hypothetical protein Nepgr_018079 [Nepenthes gracilis]|uniref:Glycoside hydrolase 123 catalytic domain-containing protein n=1 Tax=Nepenthes gracilis TaxID=150966 RepID=A0AAD3SRM6_NEPGR|nr:hypothetical protein Nepgr_018079 [Nepenthes gracilis]